MMKKHMKIIFGISLIAVLFGGLFFGSMYREYQINKELKINQRGNNLIKNVKILCYDYDLNTTAYCLRDFINRGFDYYPVKESVTMSRTYLEIYEDGGDCLDYSILYSKLADGIGYESEIIMDIKDQHAYVKIYKYYDEENYCILDLIKEPECFIKEKDNEGIFAGCSLTFGDGG